MIQIIKDNKYYFSGLFLFLFLALILLLKLNVGEVLLFFSANRTNFGDLFFKYFTKVGEEWAYIGCLVFFLFHRLRYALLIPVVVILVLSLSFSFKFYFQHDRPYTFFIKQLDLESNIFQLTKLEDLNFIEGVEMHIGKTSFPSGHTMSGFALFGLLALFLKRKRGIALLCLTLAILVGISRIYLAQHFLKDVFAGAIIGTLVALIIFYCQSKIPYASDRWYDQSIFQKTKANSLRKQV